MRRFDQLVQVLVGVGLLVLLFYWLPVEEMLHALNRTTVSLAVAAFLLTIVGQFVSIFKLHRLLLAYANHGSFGKVVRSYYYGTFYNNFIPTSVGGDIVKSVALLEDDRKEIPTVTLSVILERLSGIGVLLVIALGFLLVTPGKYLLLKPDVSMGTSDWALLTGMLIAVGIVTHYVARSEEDQKERVGYSIGKYFKDILNFPVEKPGVFTNVLILSVVFHGLRAEVFVLLASSFGYSLSYVDALFILPIIAFASFLPVSFGGLGIREGIITLCLAGVGLPLASGFLIALLYRVFTIIHSLIGGLLYLWSPIDISALIR